MLSLIIYLFIIAVIIAGGLVLFASLKKKSSGNEKTLEKSSSEVLSELSDKELASLDAGDVVDYMGQTYLVDSRWEYREDSFVWNEYMLTSGDEVLWLSVEEDESFEIYIGEKVKGIEVDTPPPKTLTYNDEKFTLDEKGQAFVKRYKNNEEKIIGHCKYYDYEGDKGNYLTIEVWGSGGEKEFSINKKISKEWLKIYKKS